MGWPTAWDQETAIVTRDLLLQDTHARLIGDLLAWARAAMPWGPRARVFSLVGGAVVLWASWPTLATIAAPAPPFLVLGLAALIGFVVSGIAAAWRSEMRAFTSVPLGTRVFVAFGLMGNNAFYLAAISRIGPAEANVVHYLWPVFLVVLSAMMHRNMPGRLQMLGIALGFGGVALALSPRMEGGLDLVGVLLGASGALTFAVYSAVRSVAKVETNVIGPSLALAGIGALMAHLAFEPSYWPSASQWAAIVLMGIGPFTMANILWDKATREGPAATISSLAFLTPLVALTLLAGLGLGTVTLAATAGAVLVVAGAVLGTRS